MQEMLEGPLVVALNDNDENGLPVVRPKEPAGGKFARVSYTSLAPPRAAPSSTKAIVAMVGRHLCGYRTQLMDSP
jgi:hypothetical protein